MPLHETRAVRRHRSLMLALAVLVACAGACDREPPPRSTTQRSSDAGDRAEKLRVKAWADHARFECLESTPGPCLVTVYTSTCDLEGPADLAPACRVRLLREYRLAIGEARTARDLPAGYRWCMRHGDAGTAFCRRA